jgi:hypothetical protein
LSKFIFFSAKSAAIQHGYKEVSENETALLRTFGMNSGNQTSSLPGPNKIMENNLQLNKVINSTSDVNKSMTTLAMTPHIVNSFSIATPSPATVRSISSHDYSLAIGKNLTAGPNLLNSSLKSSDYGLKPVLDANSNSSRLGHQMSLINYNATNKLSPSATQAAKGTSGDRPGIDTIESESTTNPKNRSGAGNWSHEAFVPISENTKSSSNVTNIPTVKGMNTTSGLVTASASKVPNVNLAKDKSLQQTTFKNSSIPESSKKTESNAGTEMTSYGTGEVPNFR